MNPPQKAIRNIVYSIVIGILLYFIVGFGGCLVRIVGTNTWIKDNSPGSTFDSYTHEAVLAFVLVIGIGIFSALREVIQPQLSATTNRYFSLGFKAGLISFPIAAIIVFGFAGFSAETKTESRTGRYYTVVDSSGISLKGNQYSKNDMIEVLEETENAVCLKLPSGRECYPTPSVLERTGKTNVDSILRYGNVDTKTVQNKQVVTSAASAFFGNLLISSAVALLAAILTIFISKYISVASEQQSVLGLGGGASQTNYSSTQNGSTSREAHSPSSKDFIQESKMQDKIRNVLNQATQSDNFKYIVAYKEIPGKYQFELITAYSKYGHQTLLRYEATGDLEFVRIEIKHRFGYLDIDGEPNAVANQLLGLLRRNIGAFNGTTAFLGVEFEDGKFYATLGSFHHFVTKWSDKDIANALTLHIFDIITGLMVSDASLTILKHFGD